MLKVDEVTSAKISVLVEDHAGYETPFLAQHGISLHLEASEKRIILDAGQSAGPILHNMDHLGIDPGATDALLLSHCHYDHTQGLVGLLKAVNKSVPVIAHPEIFRENCIFKPFLRNIGITEENGPGAVQAAGGRMFLTAEPFEIMPGVISTGEVPREVSFEEQGIGTYNLVNHSIENDAIMDDMSIVVNVRGKGLLILVGCSHAGIVNIINHARRVTGIEKVEGVIGGLHLIEAGEERIEKTAEALKDMEVGWAAAGHCTGFRACSVLSRVLGSSFDLIHSGKVIEV
ncbi:MAG: MBL fold metallo-hydrolase [Clostridiales bacterium]|nr:MBL fold metallo-hydrolase [Clostridiales bacterium]MCF8023190.1 MBL fold metallo-hydrolase [Clostridiales bacterium]